LCGLDKNGDFLSQKISESGVTSGYQFHATEPTAVCAIIHNVDDKREVCLNLKAARSLSLNHVKSGSIASLWSNAMIVYIEGHLLIHQSPLCLQLAVDAQSDKKLV